MCRMIAEAVDAVQATHPGLRARCRPDGGFTLCLRDKVVARVVPMLGDFPLESSGGISHTLRRSNASPIVMSRLLLHCVEDGMRELAA